MTGESHSRPTQRMSRFSQAYRTMPAGGEARAAFDQPAESVLSRVDDGAATGRGSPQRQRFSSSEPYADVIEVEFETVSPALVEAGELPATNGKTAARASSGTASGMHRTGQADTQAPPPDIEAIAAALAMEMDRNAALKAKPAEQPREAATSPEPLDMTAPAPHDETASTQHAQIAAPEPRETATPEPSETIAPEPLQTAEPEHRETAAPPITPRETDPPVSPETPAAPDAALPSSGDATVTVASAESPSAKTSAQIGRIAARISPFAKQAGHFARTKAGPAMMQAGFWLAQNLRRKEIRRRYGKVLGLAHGRVLDRRLEQHFFIPSLKAERFAPDPGRGILYEGPVPSTAFNWVMSALPQDLREYAFVDFRAGLGRAMLLASQRRFERIVGYEYSVAAYDDLQMNIAQFPRSKMLCRDIQCHRGDRTGVSIPDQPCVLYVANAWREDFLANIMTYLGESYRHKPRRLFLILENVDEKVALPKGDIFYRLDLPLSEKLKLRLLSPMDFQVYRTLA